MLPNQPQFVPISIDGSWIIPQKIIHSGPCTIVFWQDDTKTVVRLSENDLNDEYAAFCAALAIKIFGSNSQVKKIINEKWEERWPWLCLIRRIGITAEVVFLAGSV